MAYIASLPAPPASAGAAVCHFGCKFFVVVSRVPGFGFRISNFGFRVSGLVLRGCGYGCAIAEVVGVPGEVCRVCDAGVGCIV